MLEAQVSEILSQSYLFRRVSSADISALAAYAQEMQVNAGEVIYAKKQPADALFFISKGIVQLTFIDRAVDYSMGLLTRGDFFGLECLKDPQYRLFTASALEDVELIRFTKEMITSFVNRVPRFQEYLDMALKTREILPNVDLRWKEKEELVVHYAHKHPIFLWFGWFVSLLIGMIALLILISASEYQLEGLLGVGIIAILLAFALGVWLIYDYYNDSYIVTNRRVVWLEKVVGLYDTRQEASMTAIRAVDYVTYWFSRLMGYGTVTVRTFTSSIPLRNIKNPQYVADIIEEFCERVKKQQFSKKEQNARQTLRQHLGLEKANQVINPDNPPATVSLQHRKDWGFSLKLRLEDASGLTFRKHWIILLSKAWFPSLGLFFTIWMILLFVFEGDGWDVISPVLIIIFGLIIMLGFILWGAYHYADWRNDIYRVTSDQIIDIEKKPFGREEKKSAPLESILSITVERKNIIGIIFNFGNVNIDSGGTIFIFKNIYDPNTASLEISRRVEMLREKKEQMKLMDDNRRYLEWLAAYHREVHPQ